MAYGQSHTQTIPTVGQTAGDDFATMINAVLTEMRATLDAKVTPAGIDVNADLSMRSGATYYGLKDVHRVSLRSHSAALAAEDYPSAAYVFDGDLYFNDADGNQIALTSGGAIAGSSGSITGSGYGTPVEVNWDSGATLYHFYSAASTYSDIRVRGLRLDDASSNAIRLLAPSLGADYTLTFPNAVPAANNSVVQVSTAGAMSWTDSPTVTSLTTTDDVTVGDDLAVAGVTALADTLTMATNKNIVLQGTGKIVHGTRTLIVAGCAFRNGTATGAALTGSSGTACVYAIPLPAGTRITNITWEAEHSGNSGTRTYKFRRIAPDGSSSATIETDSSAAELAAVTVNTTTDTDLTSSNAYFLEWDPATNDELISVTISYTTPA